MQVNARAVSARRLEKCGSARSWLHGWRSTLTAACLLFGMPLAHAAQVQHLNTQSATASGKGAAGVPTIASFNIACGKNRVLFIWPTFERDHCSNADVSAGFCVNGNIVSTGLAGC
jgi:hypothetical protein